ncbi:MAG: hypothetical protein A4S09_01455 [Proteobacteria bacterium SG_bin7]|nr:MAG: hypothetical protein A4S09_01455 [Proteobacteria bacterium SG_bin7]
MKTLTLKVGDRHLQGKVLKIRDTLWVHLGGETFLYKPESRQGKQKQAQGISSNTVTSPMPGKVIKIAAHVNDEIMDGQVVVIMEAMKMEYSLKSTKAGKVKKISCKVGDQVQLGQILLEVE